jgi:phosphonatase-like hydrolase
MSAGPAIPLARPTVAMSPNMAERMSRHVLENIDLMVCDMAGTTVQEGGLVYKILQKSMQDGGLEVTEAAMHPWHGAKKEAVIEHFARQSGIPDHHIEDKVIEIADVFTAAIDVAYFDEASTISHIEIDLASYFRQLKAADIKIALDTGYPPNIQEGLVKRLGFDSIVDSYISSYDVKLGRPYPYMIHTLMERLEIENVKRVAKVGDSCRDMEMGRNAGCGLVVGVLSGADSLEELMGAGADLVVDVITSLPVPRKRARIAKMRLPDLS